MRNRKFKLSDMIPNAWFYKLQEISGRKGRPSNNLTPSDSMKKHQQPPPPPPPQSSIRKSYYFNRELKPRSSTSSQSPAPEPEFQTDSILVADSKSLEREIVIDMSLKNSDNGLPPIITKQKKKQEKQRTAAATSANSPGGVRLRNHSPRIGHRKISGRKSSSSRRSLPDSLAVMKSSYDPQKDFRESMVEMIVENNINAPKDLENLLACYLCLNADEYHDLIIEVFKQIWFDLTEPAV